ncbi:unnamed protein product [Orchesella dallaii]|uniref:Gustatory receptor n=1 Tax=Orchesella dallaii TaxID=48710 RepID=A0ABP1S4J6_9HEXA
MDIESSLNTTFTQRFLTASKLCFGSTIFTFSSTENKLLTIGTRSSLYQRIFGVRLIIALCMITLSIFQAREYHLNHKRSTSSSTSSESETSASSSFHINTLLQAMFFISCHLSFIYIGWTHLKKQREMVNLHNAMINFEHQELSVESIYQEDREGERVCKFILQNTAMNVFAVMFGRVVATYHYTCMPDLAGYFLLEECQLRNDTAIEIRPSEAPETSLEAVLTPSLKLGIVFINWVQLSLFYIGFNLDIICFTYIPSFFFNKTLRFLSRMIGIRHKNKVKKVQLLRQIQLLLISYNDIHKRFGVVCIVGQSVVLLTICSYALIRLGDNLMPIHFIFFLAAAIQAFVTIMFVFGEMGKVYQTSEMVLEQGKKVVELQKDPWFRRVLRSWPKQKIRMGEVNYLDSLTPFNMANFSISLTVNMLLMET